MTEEVCSNNLSIAIMGGTFDPIHYGHLVAAEIVRATLNIHKVIFIPTGNPPHKRTKKVTDKRHRYIMTQLATASNPYFDVSSIEIERTGITYTIDTIKELRKIYGSQCRLYFITGADAILDILTWHNIEELLLLCNFVAVTRPGFNKIQLEQKQLYLKSKYDKEILCIEIPALGISSTDIRNRVFNQMPIKYLLPESVEDYIYKSQLYKE